MKLIVSLLATTFFCGCILMRYQFEKAINNLPPGSKLISVGNYSIKYTLDKLFLSDFCFCIFLTKVPANCCCSYSI